MIVPEDGIYLCSNLLLVHNLSTTYVFRLHAESVLSYNRIDIASSNNKYLNTDMALTAFLHKGESIYITYMDWTGNGSGSINILGGKSVCSLTAVKIGNIL